MKDVLEFILKNIVTVPDDVKIEETDEEGTTNYIVTVNPTDIGRVIGKEGKVIKAIRTVMRVIAIQRGVHVRVSIVSETDGAAPTDTSVTAEIQPAEEENNATAPTPSVEAAEDERTLSVEV